MSAEILREAAALMRTRAEAADWLPIPTRVDIDHEGTCDACAEGKPLVASYPGPNNEPWLCAQCAGGTDYIASWHPTVALAVADWLDATAREFDALSDPDLDGHPLDGRRTAGLAVARAYLGRSS